MVSTLRPQDQVCFRIQNVLVARKVTQNNCCMLFITLSRVHSSILSLNTFIFLWRKRVIVSKGGEMMAINSLMSIEVRLATSKETCFIQNSSDCGITDEGWWYYAHFTDVDSKAQSFHDLSEPWGWWIAKFRYKLRPPDSSICFISHKASMVHLSLEASDLH